MRDSSQFPPQHLWLLSILAGNSKQTFESLRCWFFRWGGLIVFCFVLLLFLSVEVGVLFQLGQMTRWTMTPVTVRASQKHNS